jgi:beta-lactam-binding protein with PASTA domain
VGLEPSTEQVPSTLPRDTVVSQSPGGGSSALQGDHVLINISAGSPETKKKSKGQRGKAGQNGNGD